MQSVEGNNARFLEIEQRLIELVSQKPRPAGHLTGMQIRIANQLVSRGVLDVTDDRTYSIKTNNA